MQTQTELSRAAYGATHGRDAGQTFLTGPQVQSRYQKSHVTIWRWVRDPELRFPQPIQINRLNYWRLADLEAWEAAQELRGAA
jgi:predicted DNA-binding transcriptional regulator AlpA